eukprot:gene8858-9807_t
MAYNLWSKWFVPVLARCTKVILVSTVIYKTSSGIIFMTITSLQKLFEAKLNSTLHNKVMFFPDHSYYCRCVVLKDKSSCVCDKPESSFESLLKLIDSAQYCIDICMFVLSSHELAGAVLDLHKRGLTVRVITDAEKMEILSSQIMNFRAAGIQVRNDKSAFLMHHKFAIIDNRILITGSFNWTHQAVTGNKENVLTTSYAPIVQPFIKEFERLWKDYDPEIVKN